MKEGAIVLVDFVEAVYLLARHRIRHRHRQTDSYEAKRGSDNEDGQGHEQKKLKV